MDDEQECPECEAGLPAWLATFADLMSLLMCFFVLLLSFATMDATRFKKMAESMKDAFGVQREVPAYDIVMGTSVIKTEFSPSSVSDPSLIDEVRQQTTDVEKQHLDVEQAKAAMAEQIQKELEQQAEELKEELKEEISEGLVNVETEAGRVIIRIQEKGSFSSGRASLNANFYDVMARIGDAVAKSPGKVVVAGHTDDVPISTTRFRSNWELSSARAVTVVHALLRNSAIDPARVLVEGHADSHPLVPNDSHESRSKNRRVELIIKRGEDADSGETLDTGASKG
ncbi:MAG: type VI secretion system protein TssL, long form [Candidatus Sedimenticola sp. (ex Thyasira tokunagai)]